MTEVNKVAANTTNERDSGRAIDKAISVIRKTGVAFLALVQDTIVAIIAHSNEHGDCTRAAALVDAMPKTGMRRGGAIQHFKLFGGINVSTDSKTKLMRATRQRDETGALVQGDLDKATAIKWYENSQSKDDLVTFDMSEALKKVENLAKFVSTRLDMTQKDKDGNDLLVNGKPVLVVTDDIERQRLRDLSNTLRGVEKQFQTQSLVVQNDSFIPAQTLQEPEVQTSIAA